MLDITISEMNDEDEDVNTVKAGNEVVRHANDAADAQVIRTDKINTVLFDLDGTLSDSASGILWSMRAAFEEHGIAWLDDETANSLLGPPFHVTLPPLVGAHRLESVVAAYRRTYVDQHAMFDTSLYPGIVEVLESLHGRGFRLAVATSKPEPLALRIVEHLGIASWFKTIGGDTLDEQRGSKALVVGEVLRRLDVNDPATVAMVGDRHHDVDGARAHRVGCFGALWGYGSHDELAGAGAIAVCTQAVDLLDHL